MTGTVAYVLGKKYTKESLLGGGAVVGKNVIISSITSITGGNRITFSYTLDNGNVKTSTLDVKNGLSITGIDVNTDNTLTYTMSDGTTITSTNKINTIKGDKGDKGVQGNNGVSPVISENVNNTDEIYKLDITTATGTIVTPNLKGSGGGSDKFDREDTTAVTVGGLSAGSSVKNKTTKDVLEEILFPYQKPTVSFSISPSTTTYIVGDTITSIRFTISVGKKSNDIQSIKIYNGFTLLTTITDSVANGGTFTYTYACNITSNTTLKVDVLDGSSTVSTTKSITFAYKSYYGFIADGTIIDETVIKALQNSIVKTSKSLIYNGITCEDSKIVYAYPQNQGLLNSILDSNGFDYIDSYDCTNVTVNGINYNVYIMIDPVSLDNYTQKFA